MKNLMKKFILTATTALAIAGVYSPAKNVKEVVYAEPSFLEIQYVAEIKSPLKDINISNSAHYSESQKLKIEEITKPYLEFQKLMNDNLDKQIKIKHKIEKGDTFFKVAKLYGTSVKNVDASNPQSEEKDLQIGEYLNFSVPKKSLRGYLLPENEANIKKNKEFVKQKTPEEFLEDRNIFGKGLVKYLGINSGDLEYDENKIIENFEELKFYIVKHSEKYGINPRTIAGICKQESGFRHWTASKTGSYGPCGHTKDTYGGVHYLLGKKKEKSNPFNLDQHIEDTVKEYKQNIINFSGSKKLALAAYNQGRGKVYRALKKVAKKRGLKERKITTNELIKYLKKTGKGKNGFVNEVLNELPKEGKKYPQKVLNQVSWLSAQKLI